MTADATQVEFTATCLRQFLSQGAVQRQVQPEAGAVAGSIRPDGSHQYVYGEITGYYLHWLASLNTPDLRNRASAQAALQWLQGYLQSATPPLTRVYLDAAPEDWRNKALFAFDFAMIAAGLARAAAHNLIVVPGTVAARVLYWLQCFVTDTQLHACTTTDHRVELPVRWSTRGGSVTAKTASRILLFARHTPVAPSLFEICRTTLARIAQAADTNAIDMLHPTLYALEGCLLYPQADYTKLAHWFDQIIALRAPDGTLPESVQTPDIRRSDIIAQALRIAVFLERLLERPGCYREARSAFTAALCERVSAEGRIGFTAGVPDANTWCAMFAEQALRLQAAALREQALPFALEDIA